MEIALRDMGLDASMLTALHEMFDFNEESDRDRPRQPSRTFVRDSKAMRATAADILEFPNSYVFIVDMPGVKPEDIQVQIEDGNMLTVSGERRREKEREHKEGVKYVKMERRQGKFFKRFELPENASTENISAHYQNGVLTITVEKKRQEQKKAKTIEVRVCGPQEVAGREGKEQFESSGPQEVADREGKEQFESSGPQEVAGREGKQQGDMTAKTQA